MAQGLDSKALAILHLSQLLGQCALWMLPSLGGAWAPWTIAALAFTCWSWKTLPQVIQPGNLLYGSLSLDSFLLNEFATLQDRAFNGWILSSSVSFSLMPLISLTVTAAVSPGPRNHLTRAPFSPNSRFTRLSEPLFSLSLEALMRAVSTNLASVQCSPVCRLPLQDFSACALQIQPHSCSQDTGRMQLDLFPGSHTMSPNPFPDRTFSPKPHWVLLSRFLSVFSSSYQNIPINVCLQCPRVFLAQNSKLFHMPPTNQISYSSTNFLY